MHPELATHASPPPPHQAAGECTQSMQQRLTPIRAKRSQHIASSPAASWWCCWTSCRRTSDGAGTGPRWWYRRGSLKSNQTVRGDQGSGPRWNDSPHMCCTNTAPLTWCLAQHQCVPPLLLQPWMVPHPKRHHALGHQHQHLHGAERRRCLRARKCGWGPYAREASVWEACCWHSGVINMS